jgi:histidyl-tRNA synthetase
MKTIIQAVKGTRDFYPEDMALRSYIYAMARQVSEAFGYQEYDAPFLETIDLYAAKSGQELVKEQSFVFADRGGDLITLRPELTPSLARMVAQRQKQLIYPVRWWSFGPFWRYERPQKGRSREFFQWNIDLFGVDTPEADAELVAIACAFMKKVRLTPTEVNLVVNDRRLIDAELADFSIPQEQRPAVLRWIDRRGKMSPDDWNAYGQDIGLSIDQTGKLKELLSNPELWRKSEELVRFFAAVESIGYGDYVRFDPNVVRGLDYYTGIVFEAIDMQGDVRRSILGGGRYDDLLADVGGDPLPGVGFAMGDMVIALLLEKYGRLPKDLNAPPAQVLVTIFDENSLLASFRLAEELRRADLKVSCYPEAAKLGKQFKYADRVGISLAVIMGPDEMRNGQVSIKDLKTGEQRTALRSEAAEMLREMLEKPPSP